MQYLRQSNSRKSGWLARRPSSALALLVAFAFWLAQMQTVYAAIDNDAFAFGSHGGGVVFSPIRTVSVPVVASAPDLEIEKTGVLNDDDGVTGISAGDTIDYRISIENTGAINLTGVNVTDMLTQGPVSQGLVPALDPLSDPNSNDILDVDETWIYNVSYTLTNTNISSADQLVNTATVRTNELPPREDRDIQILGGPSPDLIVEKTVVSSEEILPNVVEVEYLLRLRNVGNIQLSDIALKDNLLNAISAPASLLGAVRLVSISGFTGTGRSNPLYDGISDDNVLIGDVQLDPFTAGEVRLKLRVDRKSRSLVINNIATVTADEITGVVASDDPTQTPSNTSDINPTPYDRPDGDDDGAPDLNESASIDRDRDGIPDRDDYDPTGYLYCETDGRILSGGLISVQNAATGAVQTGLGSSNNITILHDGSNGFYQFYVTAPGRYRLLANLPTDGVASTSRLTSGRLDVTSLLPFNPGILGGGEIRDTGVLSDFTQAGNPFFTEFDIELGDPSVFNNNIPLQGCNAPSMTVQKTVIDGPELLSDGSNLVTYRIDLENNGETDLENVSLSDNLQAVFNGNFTIEQVSIGSRPLGSALTLNAAYNGVSDVEMLAAGSTLPRSESISLLLQLRVDGDASTYVNEVIANASNANTSLPLDPVSDQATISITPNIQSGIIATKTTAIDAVPIGGVVPYTITFANPRSQAVNNADIVDFLPAGFTYVEGSARLNGVPLEPNNVTGRELVWSGQTLAAGSTKTLTLALVVGAAAGGTEFINTTFMRDPTTGSIISNQAKARVRLEIESQFHCSHVIGRVFDDLDGDGYYDQGEPGLGGIRVVSVNGLLITTDEFGRYHVACDAVPADRIGSNYILKLDERTLPTGFTVTSENPRVVRMTRGKLVKINFAATNLRNINLELSSKSFASKSKKLKPSAIRNIAQILPLLDKEPSVLKIAYRAAGKASQLERSRLRSVARLIKKAWAARERLYKLEIDTKFIR